MESPIPVLFKELSTARSDEEIPLHTEATPISSKMAPQKVSSNTPLGLPTSNQLELQGLLLLPHTPVTHSSALVFHTLKSAYSQGLILHDQLLGTATTFLQRHLPDGLPPHAVPIRPTDLEARLASLGYPTATDCPYTIKTAINIGVYRILGALGNTAQIMSDMANEIEAFRTRRGDLSEMKAHPKLTLEHTHRDLDWEIARVWDCPAYRRQWRNVEETLTLLEGVKEEDDN